ncbi:malonate--CoA ligase [Elongatibacter sediminis]|uniref:Malonyl-CoA synthase n=1 Tax=Elongatibacter sediminis TaxID=3119006 RepID=A0AAW9RBN3_9GAMM
MQKKPVNLFALFSNRNASTPDRTLLETDTGQSFTFTDLDHHSARIARYLRELGLSRGDRVTVQVEKSPEALCLYLACLRGGFVYHPLNLGYTPSELRYFIADAQPALVVCDPSKHEVLAGIAEAAGTGSVLTLDAAGHGSLSEGAAEQPESAGPVRCEPVDASRDDLAALLYSSGTTGTPKGIMLTHGNLISNTETLVDFWQFSASDRLLHALPMFHVHGLFVAIGCVLASGASMRWLPNYDPGKIIEYLPECTIMMGVPTYYTRLLARTDFSGDVCGNMRLFISGSAPLLPETFQAFEARTGHRILERYGMTETNMNTSNPVDGERRPGTVGPPLPGVEARVVDDQGQPVANGAVGHLQIRGPNVFAGYWNLPDKTAEDFTDDGFFNTGDQGTFDDDGYVSIVGRAKDLVISGGLNVYPKEVELVIDRIAGVSESAVIGVPHDDFGEGVVAVVVPQASATLDEETIIRGARADLAAFKVPKRVFFVDELPRNTMAKVQKNVLRETYRDTFSGA